MISIISTTIYIYTYSCAICSVWITKLRTTRDVIPIPMPYCTHHMHIRIIK